MADEANEGPPPRRVFVKGAWGEITVARLDNDNEPFADFFEELDEADQAKLSELFKRMADHGKIHNVEKFKQFDGDLYEFKSYQLRVLCYQDGKQWALLHGFRKKQDRAPKRESDRAEAIMSEDQARVRAIKEKAAKPEEKGKKAKQGRRPK